MVQTANTIWRDFNTDGVPSSEEYDPKKADIRAWGTWVESIITAFTSNGGLIYSSKAAMDADLTHPANSMAWVIGDSTVANNGIYRKIGASGTGSWTRVADLPFSFIIASDTGAGTPNAIQATTSIPVSSSALVWMNVFEANTASPVTVSFNGGSALTIKTNSGNDVAAGGLTAGMIVMGIVSGSAFRLVSDQASSAIVAAAEAAQAAAEAAAASINVRNVADRTALKALNTSSATLAFLAEAGRQGIFRWRTGDYSALVTADPQEGVYIKADAVASSAGAWVRQDGGWLFGDMRAEWFGAIDSTDGAATATVNRAAIQAAINLRYHLRGGVVRLDGFFYVDDFLAKPASVRLKGGIRHSVLLEFGDTTGGVEHPNTGTVIHTYGAGTARLWTDESGTGSDTPLKVLVAELGENGGIEAITLQTTTDSDAWDIGIHICGVSRGRYVGLDVRGAWKKEAHRLDATWSRTSANMMASAFLPSWFDANYKATYDIGLTNNYFEQCRFEGAGAMAVEGGPSVALSTNGISDTVYIGCEFHNDQSTTTLATRTGVDGHLVRLNYRIAGLGGAQGLMFIGCRFDAACRWAFDIDYWANLDLVQRCFGETSNAYITYQQGQGVPTAQQRARIRTTTNTTSVQGDVLRFCGEFFFNVAPAQTPGGDDGTNTLPRTVVPGSSAGRRIIFETGAYIRNFDLMTDGEVGSLGMFIRSWRQNGRISLQNMFGGGANTWGYVADNENNWGTAYDNKWGLGTVTFQRNAITFASFDGADLRLPVLSTTANAGNLNWDSSTFRVRVSTSSETYKTDIEPVDIELSKAIILGSKPVWYRSVAEGDNPSHSHWGFIAEQIAQIDPRMVHWKKGETVYHRYVDVVVNGEDEPVLTWTARYEDGDEMKALLIEVEPGRWIPLTTEGDPFIQLEMGSYEGRVVPDFVPYEKPKPDGVQYERFPVHEVAVIQELWQLVQSLQEEVAALKAASVQNS
jgi:hypothetical protein